MQNCEIQKIDRHTWRTVLVSKCTQFTSIRKETTEIDEVFVAAVVVVVVDIFAA